MDDYIRGNICNKFTLRLQKPEMGFKETSIQVAQKD